MSGSIAALKDEVRKIFSYLVININLLDKLQIMFVN